MPARMDASRKQTAIRLYEVMCRAQRCDERLRQGAATGEFMCVFWPSRGQEATAAPYSTALRRSDRLVTTFRGIHDLISKGVPLEKILGEVLGRSVGACRGKGGTMHIAYPEAGVMLATGIVGAGIPIAAGLALAAKRRGRDDVTAVSFGDGATNTGAFHEGLNLAALWQLPVVFVCQNNRYAEMTPLAHSTRVGRLADRAAAYAIPGEQVDGNDPLAVHDALDAAVRRARSGGGPTLLECVTYRFNGHYFGDPMNYIPPEELRAAMQRDPVPRFRERLIAEDVASAAQLDEIEERASGAVEEALQTTLASPPPPADELERDVYATPEMVTA